MIATSLKLCATEAVPLGEALRVEVEGYPPLAVFHMNDGFFITNDTCTHGVASLAEGEIDLEDGIVECPWHSGAFDVATGKACAAPCTRPLKVYPVHVEDGFVHLVE